jgi:hypothetical protein
MPKVTIEGDDVVIALSPMDKFWALHGSMRIPREHITGARVEDENGWKRMWGKIIGTNAPGLKIAGTFFGNGGLMFCDYGSGRNCLVIETRDETYKTVIVQVDEDQDAAAIAAQLSPQ